MARDDREIDGSTRNGGGARRDRIVSEYLDRLNAGEALDALEVIERFPEDGPAILEEIYAFLDLGQDAGGREPLGALGDYTLRRQIGRGGMGVVYEAWENSMDRRVALKVLPAGIAADDKAVTRFVQEARLAGRLSHPNIVGVYGMGLKEQTPYYAMEYVEGETLAQLLGRIKDEAPDAETPFGKKDSVVYFGKLADAFAEVADGRLRILDFGLARLEGQESLTLSGDFLGTPQYMSPEQARRKKISVDHRTDVYSLGATMYEALAGRPPFRGKDHQDTLSQIIDRDPVEPRKVNPRVPKDLETIVLKCLRKEAGERYGTAEAMGQELRRFVRGDAVEARPQAKWEKLARRAWRNRTRLGVAALALLFFLAGGALLERSRRDAQVRSEDAVRALVMKIQVGRGLFDPRVRLGSLDLRLDQVDALDSALGQIAELATRLPRTPATHYHRASGLAMLRRDDEALKEVADALAIDAAFALAQALAAWILKKRGPRDGAVSRLESASEGSRSAWAETWLGAQRAMRDGRWADAAAAYGLLIDMESAAGTELYLGSTIELRMTRGSLRLEIEEYLDALDDFSKAEALWPGMREPALLKAKAYYLLGRKNLAEQVLKALFAASSDPAEIASWISPLYGGLKDHARALEWAELPAEGSRGLLAWREVQRARSLHHLGRWKEAEAALERAVQASPRSAAIQASAGKILHRHLRHDEASRHFERVASEGATRMNARNSVVDTLHGNG